MVQTTNTATNTINSDNNQEAGDGGDADGGDAGGDYEENKHGITTIRLKAATAEKVETADLTL